MQQRQTLNVSNANTSMTARPRGVPEWMRYLAPSDGIFIVSIAVGLFVLVFVEEAPIRLIGACMVLLSAVFLVMNISARMREKVAWSRPSVSQPVELSKKVRTDERGVKRIVFDDFATTFSTEAHEERSPTETASQPHHAVRPPATQHAETTLEEVGDDISSVRVKRKPAQTPSPPRVEPARQESPPAAEPSGPRIKHIQLSLASLMEEGLDETMTEPRREFAHIAKGILQIVRSTMNARTASFFWYNPDRRELVLEAIISDVADSLRQQRKYPLGDNIISQIVLSAQAQIVCDIQGSAECDLLPYYFQATGSRSIAGVPVFLNKVVVGALVVDSAENDAYDEQTIGTLGQCGRLMSALIQSYTTKYDLHQSARTLETIVHFRQLLAQPDCTLATIAQALVQAAMSVVEARAAGVVLYSSERNCWQLAAASGDDLPPVGTPIDPATTLIGRTLLQGVTTQCEHCSGLQRRYSDREVTLDDGYFVAVPLRTPTDNYGGLFIEAAAGRITRQDVAALEIIGEHAGMLIAQLVLKDRVQSEALLDEATQAYNSAAFRRRLVEEVERGRDLGQHVAVALLQVDRYKTFEQHPLMLQYLVERIAELVRSMVKPYYVIGRLDASVLGIIIVGMPSDRVQLFVEQIRRKIAATPIQLEGRTVAVTVSVGIACLQGNQTADEVLDHAVAALQQAARRSNAVVNYS